MIQRTAFFQFISRIKWQAVIIISTLTLIMVIIHYYSKSLSNLDDRLKSNHIQIKN